MKKALLHLADLHYRKGWIEEQGVVINAFFSDLEKQIEKHKSFEFYLVFSGDIVQAGSNPELYEEFISTFDKKLDQIGISLAHRICVPGNHDVSATCIKSKFVDHEGVVSQNLNETEFNNYIENPSSIFSEKFECYKKFETKFSNFGATRNKVSGKGWLIDDNIGIYCLNSALLSSGGIEGITDKNRLYIDTRNLHSWISNNEARWKILVMHHPIDWLCKWAQAELKTILRKSFTLCLSGHNHDQDLFHSIREETELIELSAPPLFTRKKDLLGYSIIFIDSNFGVEHISYRQWTKHHSWVSGVNFSNTDDGRIKIGKRIIEEIVETEVVGEKTNIDFLARHFKRNLEESLVAYSSQPIVWVDPMLCDIPETSSFDQPAKQTLLSDIIANPKSMIIKAPPQFGLTCLSHHLIKKAWELSSKNLWLYLGADKLKPFLKPIKKAINEKLDFLGCKEEHIKCVIIDSWVGVDKNHKKILSILCNNFEELPIIVMQTTESNDYINIEPIEDLNREFKVLYLWSLPRNDVRKVIHNYNELKPIGDEDKITTKVVTDLEVLNLHRTPLNCMTLLKVSEVDFDESPVNRTEMIKRVLFLLFNVDDIPTYKSRPDLKDCEYVLGYFSEIMIRTGKYHFTADYFLEEIEKFCIERVIDLEVRVVLDVLYLNNILLRDGNDFYFRFSYWIYYFAAQRMHHDKNFAEFIYENIRYVNFPEIIEFYTGIDRRREDALEVLNTDLEMYYKQAIDKIGFPEDLNPYQHAFWSPSNDAVEKMKEEIIHGVLNSKLPNKVKDEYADRCYDQTKPYCQEIRSAIVDYSFGSMLRAVSVAARALRNSDYADPKIKNDLLKNILRCWEHASKVILILTPVLAAKGSVVYDRTNVLLHGGFGKTFQERLQRIFSQIPSNIVSWYQNDIFSRKIGPLLIQQFANETNNFNKHLLAILLIRQRPRLWKKQVEKYVTEIKKNSFFLLDVNQNLCTQYKYSYASQSTLKEIEYLIKMTIAKHEYGTKKPGKKLISKINDRTLPSRTIN